ncbi:unnamed protein product [Thelazia callipaeda]|uniref:Probable deoxycytidylate deaminase n=1 Tax=Thelazia callipaeda TaxID=103827 RepID=A0A0N5D1A3_THECL|nr:unnamed protein product [Thelazia callipaeda]
MHLWSERTRLWEDNSDYNTMSDSQPSLNSYVGKRENYLSWEEYFMAVAHIAALRSKDPVTQVGAVIVNQDKRIVGVGYNGMPNGCSDNLLPWKKGSDFLENKSAYVCHAEMNAILNKIFYSTKGSTIYTVLFPCNECAKLIIQAGISEVVYQNERPQKVQTIASKKMFDMAGVGCIHIQQLRTIYIFYTSLILFLIM